MYKPQPAPEHLHKWCGVCDHWKQYCQCGMILTNESCDGCDAENVEVKRMPYPHKIAWYCKECQEDYA